MSKGQSKQILLIRKITKFDGFYNSSITTILIRRMSDLSVESEVQNDILLEAKRNGISINVKERVLEQKLVMLSFGTVLLNKDKIDIAFPTKR